MRGKRKTFEGESFKGYRFVEKIGEGNWATVYLVQKIGKQQTYAAKAIDQSLFKKHPTLKELVNTEISILKFCKNPNVVGFIQQFVEEDHQIIVLEYCNGGNLEEKLERQGKIEEKEAIEYLKQIMNGFKGLHEVKAMHRDFKAANIMLHNNSCKIVDLGFGKLLQDEEDMVLSKLGTKFTMAPQVLQGFPYDMKADIWSIGVVYYQLLIGQYPFIAGSVQALLDIAMKGLVFPQDQKISQNSKDFIDKCLTFQPSERVSWSELYTHPLLKQKNHDYNRKSLIKMEENQRFYNKNEQQLGKSIIINPITYNVKPFSRKKVLQESKNKPQTKEENDENLQIISIFPFQKKQKDKIQSKSPDLKIKESKQQKSPRINHQNFFRQQKRQIMQANKRKYLNQEKRRTFTSYYLVKQILNDNNIPKGDHLLISCILFKQTIENLKIIHQSIIKKHNIFNCKEFQFFCLNGLREMDDNYISMIKAFEIYLSQKKVQASIANRSEVQKILYTHIRSEQWQEYKNAKFQQYEITLRKIILERRPIYKTKLLKWSFLFHQYSKSKIHDFNYQKILNKLIRFQQKRAQDNLIKKQRQYQKNRQKLLKDYYRSIYLHRLGI